MYVGATNSELIINIYTDEYWAFGRSRPKIV